MFSISEVSSNALLKTAVFLIITVFFTANYNYIQYLNLYDFYGMMNIAFDFDQKIFVKAIDGTYIESITAVDGIWIKHPFVYLYSYLSIFLQLLGLTKFTSILIICLASVTASLFLMWKTFMLITEDLVLSILLLMLLASTSSVLSIAVVFDSYSILSLWSSLVIFLFCRELVQGRTTPTVILAFVYVMLVGITVYMILLVFFIELIKFVENIKINNSNFKSEYKKLSKLFLLIFIYAFIFMLTTYPEHFLIMLTSPIDYAKEVLWAVIRPGEKASIFEVFYILLANGLIAPKPTLVPIPDGFSMFDLRSLQYSIIEFLALFFIAIAISANFISKNKIIIIPFFLFTLISIIFHVEYHDRGSLFLYASHIIFPLFILISFGIKKLNSLTTKVILIMVIAVTLSSSLEMLSYLGEYIQKSN